MTRSFGWVALLLVLGAYFALGAWYVRQEREHERRMAGALHEPPCLSPYRARLDCD